jgi:hypothetical protein
MLTTLTLALTASLLPSARATAQEKKQPPTAPPHPFKVATDRNALSAGATLEGRA